MKLENTEYRQLLDRISQLERSNRHLWILSGASIAALVALATVGAVSTPTQTHPSEPIVLSDDEGHCRGSLGFENGVPGFRLFDQSGRKRLALELGQTGDPHVRLLNEGGTVQAELSLVNGDLPWLNFRTKDKQELASFGINSYGSPSLQLSNGSYDHHLALTFFSDGLPKLALFGPDFDDRGVFGLENGGYPRLSMYGPKEAERAVFQVSPSGTPSLVLREASGKVLFATPTNAKKVTK
jgi:hypothetical protein